jgi:hypothetical protein
MSNKEEKKQVTAGLDDANSIRTFIKHFNLTITERLDKALKEFEANQTYENQRLVRKALAEFVVSDASGLMNDKMFAPLFSESTKTQYYASFDENLNELLENEPNKDKD